ncbi:uncharacterized small protein (DUF1192 family) [Bradyrhizobium sp. USDA 4463]
MSDYDRLGWFKSEIGRLEAESAAAVRRHSDALASYDHHAAGNAQREIARLETQLVQVESGRDMLERQLQHRQHRQHQQQYRQPGTVEDAIRSLPNLTDSERAYLRAHPDAIMRPENQRRLEVAFLDAQRQGLERGSDRYFDHFDRRLGYDRSGRSGRASDPSMPRSVCDAEAGAREKGHDLTAQEAAKISGLTKEQYAAAAREVEARGMFNREAKA